MKRFTRSACLVVLLWGAPLRALPQQRPTTDMRERNEQLALAVRRGDAAACKEWLAKGADVDARDTADSSDSDIPLLHVAAAANRLDILRLFLDRGADVNIRDSTGCSALFCCGTRGGAALNLLLERRANPNLRDRDLRTPLFFAAAPDAVKALIAHGADVNARDRAGASVLLFHVNHAASMPAVRLLLAVGARADVPDSDGQTPLRAARRLGRRDLLSILSLQPRRAKR